MEHGTQTDTGQWVDLYADALYSYAFRSIPNPDTARDLVQETFAAALKNRRTFEGRSKEKTWLIGILRNKIYDHLRRKYKEAVPVTSLSEDASLDSLYDSQTGALRQMPAEWKMSPSELLEREDFWKVFQECFGRIPAKQADPFALRELEQKSTKEICSILNISATNLGVLLHRARVLLRQCLENNWFKS